MTEPIPDATAAWPDSDKPCRRHLEGPDYTSTTRPLCGATPTRFYPVGRRCADHTPAALAGKPEPDSLTTTPSTSPRLKGAS